MEKEIPPLNDLDALILETLKEKPERELSYLFTDTLLQKVERRLRWRELFREFALKVGIVTGSLIILLLCLIFPGREASRPFLTLLTANWQLVTGFGLLVLFTFFSDQVLLKFYYFKRPISPEG